MRRILDDIFGVNPQISLFRALRLLKIKISGDGIWVFKKLKQPKIKMKKLNKKQKTKTKNKNKKQKTKNKNKKQKTKKGYEKRSVVISFSKI